MNNNTAIHKAVRVNVAPEMVTLAEHCVKGMGKLPNTLNYDTVLEGYIAQVAFDSYLNAHNIPHIAVLDTSKPDTTDYIINNLLVDVKLKTIDKKHDNFTIGQWKLNNKPQSIYVIAKRNGNKDVITFVGFFTLDDIKRYAKLNDHCKTPFYYISYDHMHAMHELVNYLGGDEDVG